MRSFQVWIFRRRHHGRSGRSCFFADFGDYHRVAALQRRSADLFSAQSGNPQAGARSLHPQLVVLQPVAERVQHASNFGRARHFGAPRRQRLLSDRGFPRHFPHHELNAQHGSAQHR